MTRGEPRPVHITLVATCRVYNSVVVIRRITPGLSQGYEPPADRFNQLSFVSRDLGRSLSCASAGPEAHYMELRMTHARVKREVRHGIWRTIRACREYFAPGEQRAP